MVVAEKQHTLSCKNKIFYIKRLIKNDYGNERKFMMKGMKIFFKKRRKMCLKINMKSV